MIDINEPTLKEGGQNLVILSPFIRKDFLILLFLFP